MSTFTPNCPATSSPHHDTQCVFAFRPDAAFYLPPSDNSHTAIVFAFPSSGAFALGDTSVATATPTTTLTWWGASWWQQNTLSGGAAPASFKGFASTVTLPTSTPPATCGGNWTTRPGDSPPPAAAVPSYMGVLVTSHVTKSGSEISGTTTHIVVVKVNPGYAPTRAARAPARRSQRSADAGNPGSIMGSMEPGSCGSPGHL